MKRNRNVNNTVVDKKPVCTGNYSLVGVVTFAKKQSGFGYVEYMVSTLGVLFMLFAPLPGQGGDTVVDYVMNAIRAFGQNSSLLLSLP